MDSSRTVKIERIILGSIMLAIIVIATIAIASPVRAQTAQEFNQLEASGAFKAQRVTGKQARKSRVAPASHYAGGDLVSRARSYMHTNPTGWRRLWCGRFLAMIAPDAAAQVKNPNRARSWASLPRTSPSIGAIVVMTRGKGGGHVGVVTGFDANGNPIVISGNHNNRVDEGVYPRSRVIAYVSGS